MSGRGFEHGRRETGCVGVFLDAVQEAFYYSEGYKSPDVDVC